MTLNSRAVSLTLFSLVVATTLFSVAHGGREEQLTGLPGGWSPIKDPKDPRVVEIANFAISTHNKEAKTNLKFETVIGGAIQVVAGLNYKLDIAAEDGSTENKYEAIVWDKPWKKFRQLTSFKQL